MLRRRRRALYDYCDSRGVEYKKSLESWSLQLTKTSTARALGTARALQDYGVVGSDALQLIDGNEATAMEPELQCTSALWSPETGVIDSHGLMLALQGDVEALGGMFVFNTVVSDMEVLSDGTLRVIASDGSLTDCSAIFNCAGLFAPSLASVSAVLYQKRWCFLSTSQKATTFAFRVRLRLLVGLCILFPGLLASACILRSI